MRTVYFILIAGLIFLLAACGATQPDPTQAPVEGQQTSLPRDSKPDPAATATIVLAQETPLEQTPATAAATATAEDVAPEEPTAEITVTSAQQTAATAEKMTPDEEKMPHQESPEEQRQLLASLSIIGAPPELDNEVWLNSEPLKLADLRGKVVIVEFWTYG
jgi:hypothetical protein